MASRNPVIDYEMFGQVLSRYRYLGYQYLEVPWITTTDVLMMTCPSRDKITYLRDGRGLVGSAEQSLLSRLDDLPTGYLMAATPCFRNNEPDSGIHHEYFMKIELAYRADNAEEASEALGKIISDAVTVMSQYSQVDVIPTDDGFDIELNGLEVGSYGIRVIREYHYVYGTGIALPRFTQALGHK